MTQLQMTMTAAMIALLSPLPLHAGHQPGELGRAIMRRLESIGWQEFEAVILCGDADRSAAECR